MPEISEPSHDASDRTGPISAELDTVSGSNNRRRALFGWIAIVCGILGLGAAAADQWVFLTPPPPPTESLKESVKDVGKSLIDHAVAKVKGEPAPQEQPEPPPPPRPAKTRVPELLTYIFGVMSVGCGVVAWGRKEPRRFVIAGVGLGAAALLWMITVKIAFALMALLLILAIAAYFLNGLGLG